ncbi:MAG: Ig-like domain-containing protein, partial [Clostridia bacterium]|nr:Ig-like domain-containing protein [Clostridia bacterium]
MKDGIALNAYGALLSTKPEPQEMTIGHIYSDITVEVGQSLKLYVNMTPVEADHTVTWYSENTDIVKINNDGCYFALKPGTTTLTATSTINPNCTKSVFITVIPAKSAVAKFEDENFRKYVIGFLNEFYLENGLRYEGSKIYLSETQAITGMDLCGIGIQSLNDLKNFENLETLSIVANPLTGTLNLTALKKLKHLSIDSVIFTSWRYHHYDKSHYNYTITGLKAIIGGKPVNLNLKGSGFMEIELHNGNGLNGCQIDVYYEAAH